MIGVTFEDLHSFNDLGLILSSKTIGIASPKLETMEVPGSNGVIDLTEFFGDIFYHNRTLTFNFATIAPMRDHLQVFSNVQQKLHGKKMKIVLDDDPDFYYIGRITVANFTTGNRVGSIQISCDCEPYKYKIFPTVIENVVNGSARVIYENLRMSVVPVFTIDAPIKITVDGISVSLGNPGEYTVPEIVFRAGKNILEFEGTATVSVKYHEGGL